MKIEMDKLMETCSESGYIVDHHPSVNSVTSIKL